LFVRIMLQVSTLITQHHHV